MLDCPRFKDFLRMSSCVALCSCEIIFLPNIDIARHYFIHISYHLFAFCKRVMLVKGILVFPDMVYYVLRVSILLLSFRFSSYFLCRKDPRPHFHTPDENILKI